MLIEPSLNRDFGSLTAAGSGIATAHWKMEPHPQRLPSLAPHASSGKSSIPNKKNVNVKANVKVEQRQLTCRRQVSIDYRLHWLFKYFAILIDISRIYRTRFWIILQNETVTVCLFECAIVLILWTNDAHIYQKYLLSPARVFVVN